jgi:tRNA threonylcarbamoyl adenosine modification protein YeaZ
MALIDPAGGRLEELNFDARETPPAMLYPDVVRGAQITKVAVATGPGSFTGLRVGVSFGLGLAVGLRVPIVPLRTLEIQAARSEEPVLAVSEAGRGRVYYLSPGRPPAIGEPRELPKEHEVVGWLRPHTKRLVLDAGLRFRPETELRSFAAAARQLLESAREVAYGSLELEYMQSFAAKL